MKNILRQFLSLSPLEFRHTPRAAGAKRIIFLYVRPRLLGPGPSARTTHPFANMNRAFLLLVALLAACALAECRSSSSLTCPVANVDEPPISRKIPHGGATWNSGAIVMDGGPNVNVPEGVNGLTVTNNGATITLVCADGNTVWLQATIANGKFYVNGTMSSPAGTCLASSCSPVAVAAGFYSYVGQGGSGVVPYCGPVLTLKEREAAWGEERDAFQSRFELLSGEDKDEIKLHLAAALSDPVVSRLYTDKLAFFLSVRV